MEKKFEQAMEMVQKKEGLKWYEVFESELFEEVKWLIAGFAGLDTAEEVEGFAAWEQEMAWEL